MSDPRKTILETHPAKAEVTYTASITTSHKITGFCDALLDLNKEGAIPEDADILIVIPGGGDYSNMSLPLEEVGFVAEWEVVETIDTAADEDNPGMVWRDALGER